MKQTPVGRLAEAIQKAHKEQQLAELVRKFQTERK